MADFFPLTNDNILEQAIPEIHGKTLEGSEDFIPSSFLPSAVDGTDSAGTGFQLDGRKNRQINQEMENIS